MVRLGFILLLMGFISGCTPHGDFEDYTHPAAPDYSKDEAWACIPTRHNASDTVPFGSGEKDLQTSAQVDVFYIYPTLDLSGKNWNADIHDKKLNNTIESTAIRAQATAFNGSCKVYSPRYRQGTLASFYSLNGNGGKALKLAYTDVEEAFKYYMKNYNHGRPFIIAGHSQGTLMAYQLVQEFIDTTPLRNQMVAAYLIGYQIRTNFFKNLKPCDSATQTGCYITWNSIKWGEEDKNLSKFFKGVSVNPLSWKRDSGYVDALYNLGAVNNKFKINEHEVGTENKDGLLMVSAPKDGGYKTFGTGYHIYDYSFFYMNIRRNVQQRIDAYLKGH